MKSRPEQILRREFLKKGFAGGAVLAAFPILQRTSFPASLYGLSARSECNLTEEESCERLLDIAHKYGGEFGDAHVEKFLNHQNSTQTKED